MQRFESWQPSSVSARPGFFLGDGAGVGKGRQAAALIYENHLHGRRRHLWVSFSSDLRLDAIRDLDDVRRGNPQLPVLTVYSQQSTPFPPVTGRLPFGDGVLFVTFALFRRKGVTADGRIRPHSRLGQISAWLQGEDDEPVIVVGATVTEFCIV